MKNVTKVLKTRLDRSVRPVEPGTDHEFDPKKMPKTSQKKKKKTLGIKGKSDFAPDPIFKTMSVTRHNH